MHSARGSKGYANESESLSFPLIVLVLELVLVLDVL